MGTLIAIIIAFGLGLAIGSRRGRKRNDATNEDNARLRDENGRLQRLITRQLNLIARHEGQLRVLFNMASRVEQLPSSVGKPTARLPQIVTARATRVFTEPLTEALAETRALCAAA